MAVITRTRKNLLTDDLRIDPEFYQPFYVSNEEKLSRIGGKKLGNISDVIYGTTPIGGEFKESGVPFLRSQNFTDNVVSANYVYCDEKFQHEHQNSKCLPNDILFAAIGATIGDFAIVPPWIKEGNTNQNIARVRITNGEFLPEFVWAFFLTKYGQLQLQRYPTGNAQPYLNTYQFNRFFIPKLINQDKIVQILREVFELIEKVTRSYPEVELEILERMSWGQVDFESVLDYEINCRDVFSNERIDPEFYQPKFKRLIEHLKKIGSRKLGDFCQMPTRGVQPEYEDSGDVLVINSKHLGATEIDIQRAQKTTKSFYNLSSTEKGWLNKFDALMYSTGAYIGRTNAYLESTEAIGSNHISIIRPDTKICNPVYLALFLNCPAGLMQTDQRASGSAQREIYPQDITKYYIFIPEINGKPDLVWQKKLADKIIQAYEDKRQVRQKLQQAKELVESEIEKFDL